ncbi:MAG: Tol-Pal system beta propeller repeat protein TolB [Burkholderiaceae bacterium]|jgi:TolB protein
MIRIHTAASALRPFAGWAIGLLFVSSAAAQGLRIDITGVGDKQIPVAVAPLVPASPNERVFAETVQEVLEANLRRTGAFNLLPVGPQFPVLSDNTPLSQDLFLRWKNQGASALVVGSISRQPDGKVDLRFRLLDNLKSLDLGGLSLITEATQLDARRSAHKVADYVYEQLTGEPGFFSTRLAYVRKEAGRQVLIIADSDGENAQPALRSSQPIISLAWSPDGNKLAYVSFESGKAVVYVHELQTGRRTVVANYRGSNSAPAWSPDGKQLAVVLTKDGSSQVYVMNADGSSPRRVSRANAINTEPSFSADGKSIYFTSDRGGSPQIYRVPADASSLPERISFTGNFNARPMVSPDGKLLAFVARREGKFVIGVRTLESGEERLVSTGPKDDSPSFAPNSRWIIFSSRINARDTLSAVSVDGRVRTRISLDTAGIRNPAWGRMP